MFGNSTTISLKIEGVKNAGLKNEMTKKLITLLARNQIVHDGKEGIPLTFSLRKANNLDIDKTNWNIKVSDKTGKVMGEIYIEILRPLWEEHPEFLPKQMDGEYIVNEQMHKDIQEILAKYAPTNS